MLTIIEEVQPSHPENFINRGDVLSGIPRKPAQTTLRLGGHTGVYLHASTAEKTPWHSRENHP